MTSQVRTISLGTYDRETISEALATQIELLTGMASRKRGAIPRYTHEATREDMRAELVKLERRLANAQQLRERIAD